MTQTKLIRRKSKNSKTSFDMWGRAPDGALADVAPKGREEVSVPETTTEVYRYIYIYISICDICIYVVCLSVCLSVCTYVRTYVYTCVYIQTLMKSRHKRSSLDYHTCDHHFHRFLLTTRKVPGTQKFRGPWYREPTQITLRVQVPKCEVYTQSHNYDSLIQKP